MKKKINQTDPTNRIRSISATKKGLLIKFLTILRLCIRQWAEEHLQRILRIIAFSLFFQVRPLYHSLPEPSDFLLF